MYTGQLGTALEAVGRVSLTLRGDYTKEDENGSPFVFQSMNEAATFVGAASHGRGLSKHARSTAAAGAGRSAR